MGAELFAIAQRPLEGGALQMAEQDFKIVGIDVGMLGRTVEEVIGVLDDVLIERRAGSYQHGGRSGLAASGATGALPGGSDSSGIARHHHSVERSDVDAELERVGGDHGANF